MWKKMQYRKIKSFILDILFPKFCLNCHRDYNPPATSSHSERSEEWVPGSYLCEDCFSTIDISEYQYCLCEKPQRIIEGGKCQRCYFHKLNGLYFAASYQNNLVKSLIQKFKYEPFAKEISKPLSSLIISHFQLLNNFLPLSDFYIIPVPLEKRRLKWRGFNQSEELAKELSKFLKIPLIGDALMKIKETSPQVELSGKERQENIKGVFLYKSAEKIQRKKILLVDDIYTTGATMEEAARVLKTAGAREVWGAAVARG